MEVLLAVAILSLGLAAVIHTFSTCLWATGTTHHLTLATLLSQEKLAELKQEGFPSPGMISGSFEDYPNFTWEIEVNSTEMHGLVEVRVSIFWRERGSQKEMEVKTLLARRGE